MIRRFLIALGLIQIEHVETIKLVRKHQKNKKHKPENVVALCAIDDGEFGITPYGVTEDLPSPGDLQVTHYCKHKDTEDYCTWGNKCMFQYHLNEKERKELKLPT